jgi:hypothetical protein
VSLALSLDSFLHKTQSLRDVAAAGIAHSTFYLNTVYPHLAKNSFDQSIGRFRHDALALNVTCYPITDFDFLVVHVNILETDEATNFVAKTDRKNYLAGVVFLHLIDKSMGAFHAYGQVDKREPFIQMQAVVVDEIENLVGVVVADTAQVEVLFYFNGVNHQCAGFVSQ